jgi:hypothetical protein
MSKPFLTPHCPTGLWPEWIPVTEVLPDSPRCVIVSDGEGIHIGCCEMWEPGGDWANAETGDPFDSQITHWMELPPTPDN